MIKRAALIATLIVVLSQTTGCWSRLEVNETAEVIGIGMDQTPEGRLRVCGQIAIPGGASGGEASGGSGGGAKPYINVAGEGSTLSEAARKVSLFSPRLPLWQFTHCYIFGERLLKSGLGVALDGLYRNRVLRGDEMVFIARGADAAECLDTDAIAGQFPSLNIVDVIRKQDSYLGVYSPYTLGQLLACTVSSGVDPVIPAISIHKMGDKKILILSGMAVLRGDRLAGYLGERESLGYRWMRAKPPVSGGTLFFPCPYCGEPVLTDVLRASHTMKVEVENGRIIARVKVTEEGNLTEHNTTAHTRIDEATLVAINQAASREIKDQIMSAFVKSQALGCDIFGIGEHLRRQQPQVWEQVEADWRNIYPAVEISVTVKAEIRRVGLIYNIPRIKN